MTGRLVVVGAGGHGRELVALALAAGWEVAGVARSLGDHGGDPGWPGVTWLGRDAWDDGALSRTPLLLGIGMPAPRREIAVTAAANGLECVGILSPQAIVDPEVTSAATGVLQAGTIVATGCSLGEHVHIGLGSIIGAGTVMEDFVTIGPGVTVGAESVLGAGAFVGPGATLSPGCSIGDSAIVSAGAVVVGDVPAAVVAKGVPARWSGLEDQGGDS